MTSTEVCLELWISALMTITGKVVLNKYATSF